MYNFDKLNKLIDSSNTICLLTHKMPDGDAIGSICAMYLYLKQIGKEVYMIIPEYSSKFDFLCDIDKAKKEIDVAFYDLLICLDTSKENRYAIEMKDYLKAKKVCIIDHHKTFEAKGDLLIVDDKAPATCEIVYNFLKYINFDISKEIAEGLYLGIMTDTGSFNYDNTTSNTYRICADLIDRGIDFSNICKRINDTFSETKMKLIAYIIDNMETYFNSKVRLAIIDEDTINKYDAKEEDLDSLVNYLKCIENTSVAIYIKRIDLDTYKVSMRSNEQIDVAEIAKQFGGGGHKRAAGFNTKDIVKTKKELLDILGRLLNK